MDQGKRPECVAFAALGVLHSQPFDTGWGIDVHDLYHEAQLFDGIPGTNYDGTLTEGALDYLKFYGYIDDWRYTHNALEGRDFLLESGPIVIQGPWTRGMDKLRGEYAQPRADDFVRGYHAWYCYDYDGDTLSFGCSNSWGTDYGKEGRFRLRLADAQYLLDGFWDGLILQPIVEHHYH
jgi:hypothetical protein